MTADSTQIIENSNMQLISLAIQSSPENLEKIINFQERLEEQNSRKSFYLALSKFQSTLPTIYKTLPEQRDDDEERHPYGKAEDIAEAIKPLLTKNGLSYRYEQGTSEGNVVVTCILTHKDGHFEKSSMGAPPDESMRRQSHKIASTVTYLRRYALTGALGITVADEDTDGHDAENTPKKKTAIEKQVQKQKTDSLPPYPDSKLKHNLALWGDQIRNGEQEADQIITTLSSKFSLTNEQARKIRNTK